ncbi:nitric oxide reductase activation protein NorD [Thiothrix nivea]|uniref:von Willebrand factor type A n=1 Tax=Thiothrix nivea (strain ATCC 35100 / DSM 5205 / JP2) TaxID=870187 RepID=A0A656HGC7_THINJ|nr:VWA domain-containing protein [Thiothrix nivea]EIJ34440.1 von Willebrand factor type A [Thiothrix nivea DSM 5205]
MAIQLSDYQDVLDELGETANAVLESNWHDAARVFTPRGLDTYLRGAAGLNSLGRGTDLVEAFLEAAPQVAREIGEEAVSELLSAAIKMYSRTSAAVLVLLFSTAPTAATRMGELELFKGYLGLLNTLLAQAPRSLRPMLSKLDVLLTHLTLGGLRRWAMWGVAAYRNKFDEQTAYFGLDSDDSRTIMKKEQRGVLFVDVQRRLIMYLRALWGQDFFLRPTSGDFETREGYRPYIEHYFIHLPDAFDDFSEQENAAAEDKIAGMELYRAAAAHASAHIMHSRYDPLAEDLSSLQKAMIGLVEDARVEALAIKAFPGLKQIWLNLLPTDQSKTDSTGALLDRMARAMADENYCNDDHPLVEAARALFQQASDRLSEQRLAWEIGRELAKQAESLGIRFNPNKDLPANPYRDDNRYLWVDQTEEADGILLPGQTKQVRKYVSVMEMWNNLDVEFAGDDAQEVWVLATEWFHDDGKSLNEKEGKPPMASPVHYPEWDYQTQLERPNWTTVLEKRPKLGEVAEIDAAIERNKPIISRLKHLIEAVQPQGVVRQRKQEDGDTIDINAAVDAMVSIRMGSQPDPRINIRTHLQIRDLSVVLLIDLSESTNDQVRDAEEGVTVLDMAREAAALLAEALNKVGDPFAIHGFDSNGRHDVEYYRIKDFDAPYSDVTKGRLAGMKGQLSTRMGAALRHAGSLLAQRASQKKLVILLTDGEPADNDVRDPQYLRFDTKKAVEELGRSGIRTFCLSLDPYADQYVSNIFGAKNYLVLDHVTRLPEKLPALYLSMTR